jgi:hypothetical protein
MKISFKLGLILVMLAFMATTTSADQVITGAVIFDPDELTWESKGGFDMPRLSDCDIIRQVGAPQLPVRAVQMVIPPNTIVERVEVVETSSRLLPDRRLICPAQPPQILSLTHNKPGAITFVEPQPEIYGGDNPFPAQVVEFTGAGRMAEINLANLVVYPLQYLPQEGRIRFHERVEFTLHLAPGEEKSARRRYRARGIEHPLRRAAGHLVLNGEDLVRLYPAPPAGQGVVCGEELAEYVIVTDLAFEEAFQELADWKTRKGVPARVVTTYWIDSQYEGVDRRERMRNCIADAYQNWGTIYVLLAGDTQLIPHRLAYAMDSETAYNDIPCDLYYADLDGDWNADGDETFGEVEDQVDLYPEVIIGRAPVSTVAQAENFVSKVLTYEKPTLLDYQQQALFAAEILWWDPYTDASESKELIDERYLPPRFDPVTKLYMSLGNEDLYSVINAMNQGMNIINHDGHAWYSGMGVGTGFLTSSDMDYLHNGDRIGMLYSIGCWPAAFDYDCVAEHFLNNASGGGVAFIGNSRYGWGSPGNPCFGYSDRFDQQFFKVVFQEGITRLGEALATSKAFYVPRSHQENVYRWHQYQLTLLGDPEMPLWTRTPQTLTVEYPRQIPPDTSMVVVFVSQDSYPLEGALVCLMGDVGIYQRSLTDIYGKASFTIHADSSETLTLTVTAPDYLPCEGQIMVFSDGPHLVVQDVQVQEMSGNGDGVVSPGERIGLDISLKNWGNEMAGGVTAAIDWQDEYLAVEDSAIVFGDIAPGEIVSSGIGCYFTVREDCPDGHPLRFFLNIQDQDGHNWSDEIGVLVARPVLSFQSFVLDDSQLGNGDGVPQAGEELDLTIALVNDGGERARGLVVGLETEDAYLNVPQPQLVLGDVPAGSTTQATFRLRVDSACAEPHFAILEINGTTSDGYDFQQELLLTIGRVGFSDDLEEGSHFWSHWATDSSWSFNSQRFHSDSTSWYCGQEQTSTYLPGMDCPLTTLPVVVGVGTKLSFWHWYDLATYGSDGLYVEISTGAGWQVLDFLGSGGALDSVLIGNDWFQDTYDLSHVEPGTFLQVRFRFYSDDDTVVAEGVYVDDVSITCDVLSGETEEPVGRSPSRPLSFRLTQNYPNPFNAVTHLLLTIPICNPRYRGHLPVPARAEVYNIHGQRVKTLLKGKLGAGEYQLIWDGTDQEGGSVGSGVYFCRVEAGPFRHTRKMVLLR